MTSTKNSGEIEDRVYLSKETVNKIILGSDTCQVCQQLYMNLEEDDFGSFIYKARLTDELVLGHLRKLISETTDNVAVHIMDGDQHIYRSMPAQDFFNMMHDIFD